LNLRQTYWAALNQLGPFYLESKINKLVRNLLIALSFSIFMVQVPSALADSNQGSINVDDFPTGVAVNPAGTIAYVTNQRSDSVSVINLTNNVVTNTIAVGDNPWEVVVNPAGTIGYVTNLNSDSVSVIDLINNVVTATIAVGDGPVNLAINPAGTFVYVSNFTAGTVSVINLSTNSVVHTVSGFSSPRGIAINSTATFAYIANPGADEVKKLDLGSNTLVGSVSGLLDSIDIVLSSDNTKAFVSDFTLGRVSVIDLSTNTISSTITVGSSPWGLQLKENFLYVANRADDNVSKIDLNSYTLIENISVGDLPLNIAINPSGTFGYVTNAESDTISILKLDIKSPENSQWVGAQSINCPAPNPWVKEQLGFASNVKPVLVLAENTIGKTITQGSYEALKSSGVVFDTVSTKVSTATETLPIYGCKDKLLSGKVNQPIQFIAGGYTLQSDAHGYINTSDLKWHDTNGVTLYTNTAAFMHTIKFTKTGKYVVVLTEQPDTSRGLIPTYGVRSVRFVININ
jgi:YVTN family beta-propeller protein